MEKICPDFEGGRELRRDKVRRLKAKVTLTERKKERKKERKGQ